MENEEDDNDGGCHYKENLNFCGHITIDPHIYKNVILVKKLQKCHNGHKMLAQSLKWHGNDMDRRGNDVKTLHFKISVQTPKFAPQNT